MSRRLFITTIGSILVCSVCFSWRFLPITISDSNLELAVRENLNLEFDSAISRSTLNNITSLNLTNRNLEEISGLESLPRLIALTLDINRFCSLPNFKDFNQLEILSVSANHLSSLDGLCGVPRLKMLDVSNNNIVEVDQLRCVTGLLRLDISNNILFVNTSPLSGLLMLESLYLHGTDVRDISFVTKLPNLTFLDVSKTSVNEINEVIRSVSLRTLIANNNEITMIPQEIYSGSLDAVSLKENKICSLPFPDNSIHQADREMTINLAGNPLDATAIKLVIPELIECGITVVLD